MVNRADRNRNAKPDVENHGKDKTTETKKFSMNVSIGTYNINFRHDGAPVF